MKSFFAVMCLASVVGLLSACTYHKIEKNEGREHEVEIEHEHD